MWSVFLILVLVVIISLVFIIKRKRVEEDPDMTGDWEGEAWGDPDSEEWEGEA